MATKTIDDFTQVATPATTDTVICTQSGVTRRQTIAQIVSAIKATDAQAIAATATSAVLTPANIAALKATNAEVVAGTSTTSLVTPAGLAAKTATSSAIGLVELDTDAEAITGTDTGRALTAANLKAVLQGLGYAVNMAEGTDVTAAGTCNIWTGDGNTRHLAGTTAVTNFATAPQAGSWMRIIADAAHALTHSATLDCPGSTSITCVAGDTYEVYAETPTTFKVRNYTRQDGTALMGSAAASQAEQEAGSSITVMTTPGRQQYHPSAAKAWVIFNGTGTPAVTAGYNVSSITDVGTGNYTVNFTTAFSSANYACVGTLEADTGNLYVLYFHSWAVSSIGVYTLASGAGLYDASKMSIACYGDQ